MTGKGTVELTWVGKGKRPRVERRILVKDLIMRLEEQLQQQVQQTELFTIGWELA